MAVYCAYPVPPAVKHSLDMLTTEELWDVIYHLGIPNHDAPEEDHYEWCRQRILDWLYDPTFTTRSNHGA